MTTSGHRDPLQERATDGAVALVALAHLGLVVAAPNSPDVLTLAALEVALLLSLLVAERLVGVGLTETGPLVVGFATCVGLALALPYAVESLWVAAGLLVGTVALVLYGLHRYELVALGKVEA